MVPHPSLLLLAALAGPVGPAADDPAFAPPVRLTAGGAHVAVEDPGYAAPGWHDVDGDGRADLVVGQFADGKIRVFAGREGGALAPGRWLEAGGRVAEVPGVW